VITRDVAHWLHARVSDGHDAVFTLEVDARLWRIRRTLGATSSMFEAVVPGPLSPGDLAAAVVRWASTVGLTARTSHDDGVFRVTLVRPTD
jgi:hypothetical protein